MIRRRRFAAEEERPRLHVEVGIIAQAVVQHDNPQGIQQLPLVFVNAFHLTVEDRVRVDRLAGGPAEANRQTAASHRALLRESV